MRKINELKGGDVNKRNISCEYGDVKETGYFEYKKMYGTVAKKSMSTVANISVLSEIRRVFSIGKGFYMRESVRPRAIAYG